VIETNEKDALVKLKKLKNIHDNRIHLLLYFFDGHHTKPGDLSMIKKL
jgi:septin family protein